MWCVELAVIDGWYHIYISISYLIGDMWCVELAVIDWWYHIYIISDWWCAMCRAGRNWLVISYNIISDWWYVMCRDGHNCVHTPYQVVQLKDFLPKHTVHAQNVCMCVCVCVCVCLCVCLCVATHTYVFKHMLVLDNPGHTCVMRRGRGGFFSMCGWEVFASCREHWGCVWDA